MTAICREGGDRKRTLSSVNTRMAFPPLFWTSVRGITSSASATALNGQPSTPTTLRAFRCRPTLIAISVAPPPGARVGLKTTLRATDIASARLRSISFRMSLEGPLSRIVHAFGVVHSVRNEKYLGASCVNRVGGGKGNGVLLVSYFLDVEEAAFRADVGFAQVLDAVDDRSADGEGDAVVIRFADAPQG